VLKLKLKAKASDSYIARITGTKPGQPRFTLQSSEVAVDRQEPMVLQRLCGHPLNALTISWTRDSSQQTHRRPNQPHARDLHTVSIHQMAPPKRTSDCSLLLNLSTPKG